MKALVEERQRVEALGRDLTAARSELEALKAQTARTSAEAVAQDETARAADERANTLARELAAAREEAEALRVGAEKAARAEAAAAEQGKALAEERQRVEALGHDLNVARSELEALKAANGANKCGSRRPG